MGCSCSKGRAHKALRVLPSERTASRSASRVRFFVAPPPEMEGEEQMFTTVYAARAFMKENPGWFLSTRRVPL